MIPYGRQSINEEDFKSVKLALQSEFLTTGPLVDQFERDLAVVAGAPTISVTSGTAALHCAYSAIDLKPGDEVITPPITFVATQATAALLGAKIVFADVESDTANIDPRAVEAAITSRTKAIVAVDYAGHPAELGELRVIADKHGVYLIEDAAHSIGSIYDEKPVGSIADLTTFSFFPTKNFTTGEGGAVSSPSPELLERAKSFSRQGMVRDESKFKQISDGPWYQEVHSFGLNYRLPDVLCALGISQLKRLQQFKDKRRSIFSLYQEMLSEITWIELPTERANVSTNWHLFPIKVPAEERRRIFEKLRLLGVGAQVNYMPAYRHPVFADYGINPKNFPNSEDFYNREISIPMHANLNEKDIEMVVNALQSCT
jgi:dTDP-4-amino-4,6-dideoxygalactose transaminase